MTSINSGTSYKNLIQRAMNSQTLGEIKTEAELGAKRATEAKNLGIPKAQYCRQLMLNNIKPAETVDLAGMKLDDIKKLFKGKSPEEIRKMLGMKISDYPVLNKEPKKAISHFGWPGAYSFKSAGIDEKKLIEGIEVIEGDCNLRGSSLENLGSVKKVLGSLNLPLFTQLKDLDGVYVAKNIECLCENPKDAINLLKKLNFDFDSFKGALFTGKYIPDWKTLL